MLNSASEGMSLVCISLHHRKTSQANVEKVRFKDPSKFYESFPKEIVSECVLVQTRTRVEVYALTRDKKKATHFFKELFLSRVTSEKQRANIVEKFDVYFNKNAVIHLFRLASGIESKALISLGEYQILGQVEDAFHLAEEKSAAGPCMRMLFDSAIRVGKRARSETKISQSSLSEENVKEVIEKIVKELATVKGKTIALLGAGLAGKKVAKALAEHGPKSIIVVNKMYEVSLRVAKEIGGTAIKYEQLYDVLLKSDVMICATLASHYIVTPDTIASPLKHRKTPLLIVDISHPRNVDPAVSNIPNVIMKDLGDLRKAAEENIKLREKEVSLVEKIVEEEVERLRFC